MYFTINDIFQKIHFDKVLHHYNPYNYEQYSFCKWLGNRDNVYTDHTVYVGYASQIPEDLLSKRVGIIVINDTGQDYSCCNVDFVELSPEVDPTELCLLIKENFFRTFEIQSISRDLIESAFQNASIKEITDLIHQFMGNPVFLNFHFYGRSFFYAGGPETAQQVALLKQIKSSRPSEELMERTKSIWASPLPTVTADGVCFAGKRRMHMPITKGIGNSNAIGVITVFEIHRRFTDADSSFLSFITYIISRKAGETGFEHQILGYQYEQKLNDLISASYTDTDHCWLNSLFGTGARRLRLYLIDTKRLNRYTCDSLRYQLLPLCSFSTAFVRGSDLIYIANANQEEQTRIDHALTESTYQHHFCVGVSESFHDGLTIKKYYSQAKQARKFGEHSAQSPGLYFFEQLKYALFMEELPPEAKELFVSDDYLRLLDHDRSEKTEYCKTLETYLRCGLDNDRTRLELNIHRNTLVYRLNRIEQILGHSLRDGEYMIGLYLSGIIHRSKTTGHRITSER